MFAGTPIPRYNATRHSRESIMTSAPRTDKSWYLVYTKPRQEAVAKTNLERQGYVIYLPMARHSRRRLGKYVETVEALFPRYLFIHLDQHTDNWRPIRSTLGVTTLVHFGMEPAPVPGGLVEAIQARDDGGVQILSNAEYRPGDPLRIVEGPMMGYEGLFVAKSGRDRVIMLLELIDKQVRVEVDVLHLEAQSS